MNSRLFPARTLEEGSVFPITFSRHLKPMLYCISFNFISIGADFGKFGFQGGRGGYSVENSPVLCKNQCICAIQSQILIRVFCRGGDRAADLWEYVTVLFGNIKQKLLLTPLEICFGFCLDHAEKTPCFLWDKIIMFYDVDNFWTIITFISDLVVTKLDVVLHQKYIFLMPLFK